MHLVLCSESDRPALWAYHKLRAAVGESIQLVTASLLASAPSWEHRIGRAGVHLKVHLQDGRRLCSSEIQGVLNRLVSAPAGIIDHAVAEDREYAAAETTAFYLGWLHGLRGVLNAAAPQGLCGPWRHASEWALLAAKAGFDVPTFRQASIDPPDAGFHSFAPAGRTMHSVIVLRDELHAAAVPLDYGLACRKLAALSGIDLLGVDLFESTEGKLMFGHATPFPDLTLGGDPLIDGLARALGALPAE